MAFDLFLKMGDVKGESRNRKHKDEIDVLSFSLGVTRANEGSQPRIKDFQIVKHIDAASPKLFDLACEGEVVRDATLVLSKPGARPAQDLEFYRIILENVVVTSIEPAGAAAGDTLPMEQVSLGFDSMRIEYKPQKADGSLDAAIVSTCSRTSR